MYKNTDPIAPVIFWVTIIFFFGLLGKGLANKCKQSGVLGELLMGMLVGNICYFFGIQLIVLLREGPAIFNIIPDMLSGLSLPQAVNDSIHDPYYAAQVLHTMSSPQGTDLIKVTYVVDILSRYGVIFLLFMVGLQSSVEDVRHTGHESLIVALIGVLAPILLGLAVMYILVPSSSLKINLFVAATLSATSISITARIIAEMKALKTREARTILGAAMIDDILGLVILAIVSGIVITGVISITNIVHVIILVLLFFVGALLIGPWALRTAVSYCHFLKLWEAKLFISFVFAMTLAWLATLVQLATIIGAFAAGIIIHDGYFKKHGSDYKYKKSASIKELVAPLEAILAPLFFMLIGIQVKVELFFDLHVLLIAFGLVVAAISGKLLSGLGGKKGDNRMLIGVGMIPRGEVGLVFASIGRSLGIMSDHLFPAIILMVIVTTVIVPPWMQWCYDKDKQANNAA